MKVVVRTNNGVTTQVATDDAHAVMFLENALKEPDRGVVSISVHEEE